MKTAKLSKKNLLGAGLALFVLFAMLIWPHGTIANTDGSPYGCPECHQFNETTSYYGMPYDWLSRNKTVETGGIVAGFNSTKHTALVDTAKFSFDIFMWGLAIAIILLLLGLKNLKYANNRN
jgi:hypothetical protein